MNDAKPKRRGFRFSIRELLWLTAVVALAVGWWLDHRVAAKRIDRMNQDVIAQSKEIQSLKVRLNNTCDINNRMAEELVGFQKALNVADESELKYRLATGSVSFVIAGQPEPIWGQPVDGLRAAVEFRSSATTPQADRDNAAGTFPLGSQVVADLLVQNVSDHNITFWSETSRQDDRIFQLDETGKETELHHARYSGWARMNHWEVKPQHVAVLPGIGLAIGARLATMNNFQHPIGPVIGGMPGTYSLRYELRFGGMQRTDKDGKIVIPGEGDWKGTLSTGFAKLEAHDRTPGDAPPTFTGRLEIRDVDGKPVSHAFVRASQVGGNSLFEGDASSATVEIPACTDAALGVYVRAPGYEETQFYDVVPKLNQTISLTVKRAEPVRLRLLTADGDPVVGAKVHHFLTSKMDASAGPYPTAGIHGDIWATSNSEGEVVLDSLQKIDPHDAKLGNNIYWFYIESSELAPRFIGPLQAGQDLGTVRIGPLLEVRGQIIVLVTDGDAETHRANGQSARCVENPE